jgi:hypothetical protein
MGLYRKTDGGRTYLYSMTDADVTFTVGQVRKEPVKNVIWGRILYSRTGGDGTCIVLHMWMEPWT